MGRASEEERFGFSKPRRRELTPDDRNQRGQTTLAEQPSVAGSSSPKTNAKERVRDPAEETCCFRDRLYGANDDKTQGQTYDLEDVVGSISNLRYLAVPVMNLSRQGRSAFLIDSECDDDEIINSFQDRLFLSALKKTPFQEDLSSDGPIFK